MKGKMRIRPRFIAHALAAFGGYFWLPCPICDEPFAGFECRESWDTSPSGGVSVCNKPECEAEARRRSDAMYASHNMRIVRVRAKARL
jgi:hypothetical protein